MADSDQRTLIDRLAGTLGIEEGGGFPGEALRQMFDIQVTREIAADGAANSTVANTKIWANGFSYPVQIVAAAVSPAANVAAHADNHATLTLLTQNAANGTPVVGASVDTDSDSGGAWTDDTHKALTLTPANCVVVAGGNLYFAVAKGGTGVQLPAITLAVRLRRQG